MGFLGLEWCDFPFRCLPIYRHLKEKKNKRNNRSLRVARKPAQNMAGKLAPKGKEKREKGRLFPLWQTKPHGYGPQQNLLSLEEGFSVQFARSQANMLAHALARTSCQILSSHS